MLISMERSDRQLRAATILILLLIILMMVMAGCRTCRQTTMQADTSRSETHSRDQYTEAKVRTRVDSVHIRDSIVTVIRGDSIITDRWHTAYRDRLRTDTVVRDRVRTVYRTQTVYRTRTEVREKEMSLWERTKMTVGGWAMAILGVGMIFLTFRFGLGKRADDKQPKM